MPLRRPYNPVLEASGEGPPETTKEELSSQPPPSRPSSRAPSHHSGPSDTKKEEHSSKPLPPSRPPSRAPSHNSGPGDFQKQELSFYPPSSQPPSRRPSPIPKEKPSRSVSQKSNVSLLPLQPAQPRPSLSSAHSAPSPLALTPATASAHNPLLCLACFSPLPQPPEPQSQPQPQSQPPPERSSSDSTTLPQQTLHFPNPHPQRAATTPSSPAAAPPTTPSSPAPPRWCPSCIRSFKQREASSRRADVLTVFPALVESEGEEGAGNEVVTVVKGKGWVWGRLVLMWGWVVERVWGWGGKEEQRVWVRRGAVVGASAV